jgi:hypothetical protein
MLQSHVSKARAELRPQTLDDLIAALGEDAMHQSAEEALRMIAGRIWRILVETARIPLPSSHLESRSSLLRRRRAVRILSDSGLLRRYWHRLEFLIDDPDHQLAAEICLIALQVAPMTVRRKALHRLFEALPSLNWFMKLEAEDRLCESFVELREDLQSEIEHREHLPTPELDVVLRMLQAVERRATHPDELLCFQVIAHSNSRTVSGVLQRLRRCGSRLYQLARTTIVEKQSVKVTSQPASCRESSIAQSGDSLLR